MSKQKSQSLMDIGIILTVILVLAIFTTSLVAAAVTYPSKPIRLIVPVAPGGGVDIIARLLAGKLTERLGKQMIVDNMGGAGGIIGTEVAANAAPDGYTLIVASPKHTIQPALEKLPYDFEKDFTPIAQTTSHSLGFAVQSGVPARSVKELIALAKQKPGQLVFVTSGMGSNSHLAIELFKMMAGIDFKILHFKGASPGIIDMMGGHSHATINAIPGFLPYLKSGKLRALGTGGAKRSVVLPDVPTIEEAGLPGYRATSWYGILAPAGTPALIINRLSGEIKSILTSDDVKKRFLVDGGEADYQGPTEFGALIKEELKRQASVVKNANIKLE